MLYIFTQVKWGGSVVNEAGFRAAMLWKMKASIFEQWVPKHYDMSGDRMEYNTSNSYQESITKNSSSFIKN